MNLRTKSALLALTAGIIETLAILLLNYLIVTICQSALGALGETIVATKPTWAVSVLTALLWSTPIKRVWVNVFTVLEKTKLITTE